MNRDSSNREWRAGVQYQENGQGGRPGKQTSVMAWRLVDGNKRADRDTDRRWWPGKGGIQGKKKEAAIAKREVRERKQAF